MQQSEQLEARFNLATKKSFYHLKCHVSNEKLNNQMNKVLSRDIKKEEINKR